MPPYNPAKDGAQMSFDGRMSYGDYLQIDKILDAQQQLTPAHDEMLFIIQHQTSELWMKLVLHELAAARCAIAAGRVPQAFKMLSPVWGNHQGFSRINIALSSSVWAIAIWRC